MQNVTSEAKSGDFVYIHYSGHGTRTKPCFNYSNQTTGDLALVLLQGYKSPDIYLRGPRLAGLIKAMTDKGLVVTIVLDCCFSATVYRQSDLDENVRFLPDGLQDAVYVQKPDGTTYAERSPIEYRDGSMRDQWLLDPREYTILAACGPHESAKGGYRKTGSDVIDKARSFGALSYFLSKSLSDHGLNRRHGDIHRHICAVFRQHCRQQNPVLYGNGDQGFFGKVEEHGNARQISILNDVNKVHLLAGQAHGISVGDRFTLSSTRSQGELVGEVIQTGPLTSIICLLEDSVNVQTGWTAEPLISKRMSSIPFQVMPGLPCYDDIITTLEESQLGVHLPLDKTPAADVIRISLDPNNEYTVLDDSLAKIVHVPPIKRDEQSIESICTTLEHLTRYKMVKDLTNKVPTDVFRQSIRVLLAQGQELYEPFQTIEARHKSPIKVIVTNNGDADIFAHIYNLGPSGQVKNIFGGTYVCIPARGHGSDTREVTCTGTYEAKIKMAVPLFLQEDGSCMDIIKVFITSQATSFESLELSSLQQLKTQQSGQRDCLDKADGLEDWMAFNFYVHTSL
ncbi:peptidase caspase domain [Fusarium longipes]|uniref:Peptidase caspase domain n=1 Tax=Fusarium longipes TaxID=694270 RepID=A0A395SI92_9HYPO|nr:peptidase caspase domain [Fusarium longipes]